MAAKAATYEDEMPRTKIVSERTGVALGMVLSLAAMLIPLVFWLSKVAHQTESNDRAIEMIQVRASETGKERIEMNQRIFDQLKEQRDMMATMQAQGARVEAQLEMLIKLQQR